MKTLENKNRNDEQQDSDDEKIKFATALARNRFANIDIFRTLQAFWRQLEGPRDHEGNGKTNHNEHYHQPDGPIRNLEERENLRRYLHQQPGDDCVGDCDFVNIAPLQLAEEVFRIHGDCVADFCAEKTFATSASKRGSERSGSQVGFTLR